MRHIAWLLMGWLLVACGPVYETEYRYTPPQGDAAAQTCIAQCRASQERCLSNADLRADTEQQFCEMDARLNYTRCLSQQYDQQRRVSCHQPLPCYNTPYYGSCTLAFNTCFQSCGGKAERVRVCVHNCPPDTPAPATPAAP